MDKLVISPTELFRSILKIILDEDTTVTQYPCCMMALNHILFQFPRYRDLEEQLAKKAGKPVANHTLYKIRLFDNSIFAIRFSNNVTCIGFGLTEKYG